MSLEICGQVRKGQAVTQAERKEYKLDSKIGNCAEHYHSVLQWQSYVHKLAGIFMTY